MYPIQDQLRRVSQQILRGHLPESQTLHKLLCLIRFVQGYLTGKSVERSLGLHCDGMIVVQTDKGKSVLLLFKEGHALHVDEPFFDKYPVLDLDAIDPCMCVEMLDHLVLPQYVVLHRRFPLLSNAVFSRQH